MQLPNWLNYKFVLFLLLGKICFSQQWEPLGGGVNNDVRGIYVDTLEDKIYISGNFELAGGNPANRVAVWDGSNWSSLCEHNTIPFSGSPILGIRKYNNELIVCGGQYWMGDNTTGSLAKLTPSGWLPFNGTIDSQTASMEIIDNELYLMCCIDSVAGLPIRNIAKWNGNQWDSIGNQNIWGSSGNVDIGSVVKYQNQLIVGGNFNVNSLKEIAKWDGTNWTSLNNGVVGEAWLNKIIVYKNILYVGGRFTKTTGGNPAKNFMAWDGENWFDPLPNIEFTFDVKDINVIDDELYIVANHKHLNQTKQYAFSKFDGTNFCSFGGSFPLNDFQDPQKIVGLNGSIYVACNLKMFGDSMNYFAKWTGTAMDTCIYSPITVSLKENGKNELKLLPNPTQNTLQVTFTSNQKINDDFIICDQLGKIVFSQNFDTNIGENKLEIDLSSLKQGVYFTSLKNNTNYATTKLVKL